MPWRADFLRAIWVFVTVVVGIALPIDFLCQVDGYLIYMRPLELLAVWGWGWVFYLIFALAAGTVIAVFAIPIALYCRKSIPNAIYSVGIWSALAIVILSFLRGFKMWVASHGMEALSLFMSRDQHWIILAVLLFCIANAFRKSPLISQLSRLAVIGFGSGLALTAAALFMDLSSTTTRAAPAMPSTPAISDRRAPDILLITADALAANRMSIYGYSRPTTPRLQVFAKQADVYDRFYANGNFTTPSTNSLINGIRPWTHRANQLMAPSEPIFADRGLVARLKRAGYQTFAVATNPAAAPVANQNDRWFDKECCGLTRDSLTLLQSIDGGKFTHLVPALYLSIAVKTSIGIDRLLVLTGFWGASDQYDTSMPLSAARALIKNRDPTRPMFLWVHLFAPHSPYATETPFLGRFDRSSRFRTRFDSIPPSYFLGSAGSDNLTQFEGRYDESVAATDESIGEFFEWLKARGEFDPSLILVSADHGESFGHNYGGHGGPELYEDIIHIPLLIKRPKQDAGGRSAVVGEQVDLLPTILEIAGIPIEGDVEGRSLAANMLAGVGNRRAFSMNFEQNSRFKPLSIGSVALIEDRWKYVHFFGYRRKPLVEDCLFDLTSDPIETINLIDLQPEVASEMNAVIERQLKLHGGAP